MVEPGNCASGQPRKIGYELRANGDHNQRHDGQFFMAEDQWHHVEGVYPAQGLLRLYFYDNFTKPLALQQFTGRVERDNAGKVETVALSPSPDGKTMQARFAQAATPFKVKAWVKFAKETREQPFDFSFDRLSVDPAAQAPPTTSRAPAATPRAPAATPRAPAAAARPAATPPPPPAPPKQEPRILDPPLTIPPALADALDESKLPTTIPGLLQELSIRTKAVEDLVNEGNLSQVWLPATSTKTVALALDARGSTLPERQRFLVSAAVKRVVTASWELDAYSDLGNKEKITQAYGHLSSAVTDLKAAYAGTR